MTVAGRRVLESFAALGENEAYEVALEILRRSGVADEGEISDASLVGLADELFLKLDSEESNHAHP
jgi:hypothetical protein